MLHRNHGNHGQSEPLSFESDIHDDFIDPTVGKEQETIGRAEHKVAQDHLAEAFHMFQKHGLALPVRADDKVVKCK